jgi:SH3 domain-containing protein
MIRHAAVIVVVVCLSAPVVEAQNAEYRVSAATAEVHKSPSTAGPVIGTVSRGTVLTVTRDLGSWVKIAWPQAADGVGYVHVSMLTTGAPSAAPAATARPATSIRPASGSLAPAPAAQTGRGVPIQPRAAAPPTLSPTSHLIGVGLQTGGPRMGIGASARASIVERVGVQLELSRYADTNALTQEHLTAVQFTPSLLYSLPDRLSDYVWLRPYVGGGIGWHHSSVSSTMTPVLPTSMSENQLSKQIFGGSEFVFSAAPRFGLSADYRYRWPQTPVNGFEIGGSGLSISGHWYVK